MWPILSLLFVCLQGSQPIEETQARGLWTDPSTGLMWAGKDNGKDVNWKTAVKYCRNLRLAGYSDWRLANIGELGQIYDENANAPGDYGRVPKISQVQPAALLQIPAQRVDQKDLAQNQHRRQRRFEHKFRRILAAFQDSPPEPAKKAQPQER